MQIARDSSGTLCGEPAVVAYWCRALEKMPDLGLEPVHVLNSPDGAPSIDRRNRSGLAAEKPSSSVTTADTRGHGAPKRLRVRGASGGREIGVDRAGSGDEIALSILAAHVCKPLEQRLGLDAFRDDLEAKRF